MHDGPIYPPEETRELPVQRCECCGMIFSEGNARYRLRTHLRKSRDCKRAVQTMLEDKIKAQRQSRRIIYA